MCIGASDEAEFVWIDSQFCLYSQTAFQCRPGILALLLLPELFLRKTGFRSFRTAGVALPFLTVSGPAVPGLEIGKFIGWR